ncbi:MAG: hypothetical protein FJZ01_14955 [Candidatus Sericytochromatia bacterium]|nr:hypothetical protein [Candidatus Tanganyikabacteria bacterium]
MARRQTAAQRRRGDFWTRAVLLACLAWASVNLGRLVFQEVRLTRQHLILAAEQREVDARRAALQAKVAEARSYRGSEYLARKILVLAKPDEVPVIFAKGVTPRIVQLKDVQPPKAPDPQKTR